MACFGWGGNRLITVGEFCRAGVCGYDSHKHAEIGAKPTYTLIAGEAQCVWVFLVPVWTHTLKTCLGDME